MRAMHEPSGEVVDAMDVAEDDPRKPGPWVCDVASCGLQYKGHRVATYRRGSSGRHQVGATFWKAKEQSHAPSCRHSPTGAMDALHEAHPEVAQRDGKLLRLTIGPLPVKGTGERSAPSAPTTSRERAAAVLSCARDIAETIDELGGAEDVLALFTVRHHGIDYRWREFAYGPAAASFDRLRPAIGAAFTRRRPWFVRGRTTWCANPPAARGDGSAGKWHIRVVSPDQKPKEALSVYATPGTSAETAMRQIGPGDDIAVLALLAGTLASGRPWLQIDSAEQLHVARRNSGR
ncbi:hypothetical protein C5C45_13125 [Rathayibacter rathayi]|uniref:Uncharacterized protein n=2 Tax=Rathayibacter rathayi TaxID=33887 RepID=A0ABD6W6C8_RATRA|nr:hypothetical protein [Rathayibacter rathayi]PPF11935.1 hypothetical protein C5C04_11395 [Rathayibacter rathayi]PPF45173.1 hypothetical protein C5C08_12525 [Rathayibacter rathayi]PPG11551.1 hypothetical protein C5C11_12090 [Rathayibacter rathayi]PPG37809.1 hypothetical protein C5C20_13350 [Rathayibacter rathayi]PPG66410.1 hypothetical protein C5C16_11230 [Rathayibacter rathayi]